MALKPCPECGKEISSDARTCPHCGKVQPDPNASIIAWGCVGGIVVPMLLFLYMCDRATTVPAGATASDCDARGYKRAAGNLGPGVQLFYEYGGPVPQPMGTIERIDGDNISVRYSDGGPGNVSRKYIRGNDSILVKC